ncbi:MAG: ATP-binding protein [Chloroflexota bacterium]|nr:ATP-binding protein [Chloroflexota bacterium]
MINRFDVAPERCEERDIVFDAPQAVDGLWDPVRIDHVVTNLVSNALKYSPAGGEVRVRIVEDDNWVQLDVTDSGIGIPADEQDLLFEPFARGSNTGENIAGSGLGLYIANRIVQRHGGTIAIQSALGTGTTVTARLPRNPMDSLLLDGSSTRGVYVSASLSSRV